MIKVMGKRDVRFKVRKLISMNNEDMACFSIVLFYIWQTGNFFIQRCFGGIKILVIGMYLFLALGVGLSLFTAMRKQVGYWLVSELTVLTCYLLSYIYGNTEISTLINNISWTLVICVPIALNFISIRNMSKFKKLLYMLAKPMILILCGTIFLEFIILKSNVGGYDMPVSYALIFYCIVLCNNILEKIKIVDILCLLIGLGFDLLWGSRGTYICFAIFLILKVLFDINSRKKKHILLICSMGAVLAGIVVLVIAQIYYSSGVGSELIRFRSLSKLLSGELFRSDSRLKLYSYYAGMMLEKPFLGWGVTGGWLDSQNYPHNFVLELWMAFGIIPGMLILLVLMFAICYILKDGCKQERTLFLIYFSNAFSLIVSGTFLQNMSFFMCIYLGICCMRCKIPRYGSDKLVRKEEINVL